MSIPLIALLCRYIYLEINTFVTHGLEIGPVPVCQQSLQAPTRDAILTRSQIVHIFETERYQQKTFLKMITAANATRNRCALPQRVVKANCEYYISKEVLQRWVSFERHYRYENLLYSIRPADAKGFISTTGAWTWTEGYNLDYGLATGISEIVHDRKVLEFGAGAGFYTKYLRFSGCDADAYEGNPAITHLTGGLVKHLDLTKAINSSIRGSFIVCMEVAEHIPQEYEERFIHNLVSHSDLGIILSWAEPDQGGIGHVNEKNPAQVLELFASHKWVLHTKQTAHLRALAYFGHHKHRTMVLCHSVNSCHKF